MFKFSQTWLHLVVRSLLCSAYSFFFGFATDAKWCFPFRTFSFTSFVLFLARKCISFFPYVLVSAVDLPIYVYGFGTLLVQWWDAALSPSSEISLLEIFAVFLGHRPPFSPPGRFLPFPILRFGCGRSLHP